MLDNELSTKLETVSIDGVEAVLDYKVEEYRAKKLPIEAGLADYISLAILNFDNKIKALEEYEKEIKEAKAILKQHKAEAMESCYGYLKNNLGVDKIKGIAVSSISCKDKSISIFKKFVLDEDRDSLVEKGYAHFEETIKEVGPTIRINKKRGK